MPPIGEGPGAELHGLPDVLAGVVAGHHGRPASRDDDEALVRELARVEPEDERAVDDEQLHVRGGLRRRVGARPRPPATPGAASA